MVPDAAALRGARIRAKQKYLRKIELYANEAKLHLSRAKLKTLIKELIDAAACYEVQCANAKDLRSVRRTTAAFRKISRAASTLAKGLKGLDWYERRNLWPSSGIALSMLTSPANSPGPFDQVEETGTGTIRIGDIIGILRHLERRIGSSGIQARAGRPVNLPLRSWIEAIADAYTRATGNRVSRDLKDGDPASLSMKFVCDVVQCVAPEIKASLVSKCLRHIYERD